jgi:adenylyltransferase/sulfurtransferase
MVKTISSLELKRLLDANEKIKLIDIREEYERKICTLDAESIPFSYIPYNIDKIPRIKPVIFYCHFGIRSRYIISYLERNFDYRNLYALEGGIQSWAEEVDPTMKKY